MRVVNPKFQMPHPSVVLNKQGHSQLTHSSI